MKIFISWSGDKSKAVAILLKRWLKCVIQACQPWLSTEDIERGAQWFLEISKILNEVTTGIICLTKENKEKPWLLFESGAIFNKMTESRVCTFLIDLEPKDVQPPLAQFNHTEPNKESMLKLVQTLNSRVEENKLDVTILNGSVLKFRTAW